MYGVQIDFIDFNTVNASKSCRVVNNECNINLTGVNLQSRTSFILFEQTATGYLFYDGEEVDKSTLTVSKCIDKINAYIDRQELKFPHIPKFTV